MAGDTTSDVYVPSAYLNISILPRRSSVAPLKIIGRRENAAFLMIMGSAGGHMEKPYWEDKEYAYFSHKKCEYFPCHKGANPKNFNCLFCYCPLYMLGDKCGGNFRITEKGIKDCTGCMLPHKRENYGYVTGKYQELAELLKKMRQ